MVILLIMNMIEYTFWFSCVYSCLCFLVEGFMPEGFVFVLESFNQMTNFSSPAGISVVHFQILAFFETVVGMFMNLVCLARFIGLLPSVRTLDDNQGFLWLRVAFMRYGVSCARIVGGTMIGDFSVVALIPARGGSKGIPGKNIKQMAGRPMIDCTIRAGLESRYVDDVVVSTDDEGIAEVARSCGADVPFMRPLELVSDTSRTVDAVVHARDKFLAAGKHYDVLVLLQATSPLRTAEDVDAALEMFVRKGRASLVAVTPATEHPIHMCTIDGDGMRHALLPGVNGTVRRHDMPPAYRVNGAIYINDADEITLDTSFNDNEVGFVMSAEHSVDVDDFEDFACAERALEGEE